MNPLKALGPGARLAGVLAIVAASIAAVTALLFLRDALSLEGPRLAADGLAHRHRGGGLHRDGVRSRSRSSCGRSPSATSASTGGAGRGRARARGAARRAGHVQAIVDSMADGVIFIDAQDRIALVNRRGARPPQPVRGAGRT